MARASSKPPYQPRSASRLSRQQRIGWLRLIRSENVGPATFRALVNEFGGAEAAIDSLPVVSRRGGRTDARLCSEAEAEAELEAAESLGVRHIRPARRWARTSCWKRARVPAILYCLILAPIGPQRRSEWLFSAAAALSRQVQA